MAYPKPALFFLMTFLLGLIKFEVQFDNYIDDTRHEDSFIGLTNLVDLSVLIQIGRHKVCDMVYNLLKLVLLLPVATFFFQSQLFTSTDPKAASFSLVQIQKHFLLLLLAVRHTNYPFAIDYVDTGLCFFFVALSSLSRPLPGRPSPPGSASQALSSGCAALLL